MAPVRDVKRALAHYQPVKPEPNETAALRSLDEALDDAGDSPVTVVVGKRQVSLPRSVDAVFRRVVQELARGNGVRVLPVHTELTTREAAELLNVSRPHLCKLIDSNELPAKIVGTHRRVRLDDLLDYKLRMDRQREQALAQLTRESEDLGIPF